MRNYHNSNLRTFVTYSVNDEYENSVTDILGDVSAALADTLEIPLSTFAEAYTAAYKIVHGKKGAERYYLSPVVQGCTPSELETVLDYVKWVVWLDKAMEALRGPFNAVQYNARENRSFVYVNLNTGRGIAWTCHIRQ